MKSTLTISLLLLLCFERAFGADLETKGAKTNESKWSVDFLIVDETGTPLPNVKISVAYLDTSKPGAVTITNWAEHMSYTNGITDKNGLCQFSGVGTPDAWQCHFEKEGYQKKFRMYAGPSDYTGFNGPGSAHQNHTEMLVSIGASPKAYPKWSMTIKAVDDAGNPVEGATATIYYHLNDAANGLTDSNGLFTFSTNTASWDIALEAQKAGYYNARNTIDLGPREDYDPARWNQTVLLPLRKIGKPIPMFARRKEEGMVLQKEDEPMGFDLKAGDWVAPYGKGSHTDMIFTLLHRQIISRTQFDCTLKVSFPNKGDGICVAPSEEFPGSAFRTSRTAAENGYEPELTLRFRNSELATNVFGYFIRVETSLDENGNVKSALYGKIPGGFKLYAGTIKPHSGMGFTYYLNPTPNDRNLEFDPKRNLSQNLKLLEGVNEP